MNTYFILNTSTSHEAISLLTLSSIALILDNDSLFCLCLLRSLFFFLLHLSHCYLAILVIYTTSKLFPGVGKDALGEQTNTMHIHQHRYEILFYILWIYAYWMPTRNAESKINAELMTFCAFRVANKC